MISKYFFVLGWQDALLHSQRVYLDITSKSLSADLVKIQTRNFMIGQIADNSTNRIQRFVTSKWKAIIQHFSDDEGRRCLKLLVV